MPPSTYQIQEELRENMTNEKIIDLVNDHHLLNEKLNHLENERVTNLEMYQNLFGIIDIYTYIYIYI